MSRERTDDFFPLSPCLPKKFSYQGAKNSRADVLITKIGGATGRAIASRFQRLSGKITAPVRTIKLLSGFHSKFKGRSHKPRLLPPVVVKAALNMREYLYEKL